jgi:hypothetical protein
MYVAVRLAGFTGHPRAATSAFWPLAFALGVTPFLLGRVIDARRVGRAIVFSLTRPWRWLLAVVALVLTLGFTGLDGVIAVPFIVLTADRVAGALRVLVAWRCCSVRVEAGSWCA